MASLPWMDLLCGGNGNVMLGPQHGQEMLWKVWLTGLPRLEQGLEARDHGQPR